MQCYIVDLHFFLLSFSLFPLSPFFPFLPPPLAVPFPPFLAEWLRRWTRNPLGSPRAGSNPADYVDYCIWRGARDCRLSQGSPLPQVRSSFQIPLLTGVSLPVARVQSSFEKNW